MERNRAHVTTAACQAGIVASIGAAQYPDALQTSHRAKPGHKPFKYIFHPATHSIHIT